MTQGQWQELIRKVKKGDSSNYIKFKISVQDYIKQWSSDIPDIQAFIKRYNQVDVIHWLQMWKGVNCYC